MIALSGNDKGKSTKTVAQGPSKMDEPSKHGRKRTLNVSFTVIIWHSAQERCRYYRRHFRIRWGDVSSRQFCSGWGGVLPWHPTKASSFKGLGLSQQVAYGIRMDGHTLLAKLMHKRTGEALPALSALNGRNSITFCYRPQGYGKTQ